MSAYHQPSPPQPYMQPLQPQQPNYQPPVSIFTPDFSQNYSGGLGSMAPPPPQQQAPPPPPGHGKFNYIR